MKETQQRKHKANKENKTIMTTAISLISIRFVDLFDCAIKKNIPILERRC